MGEHRISSDKQSINLGIQDKIIELLSEGETLTNVLKITGLTWYKVCKWLEIDHLFQSRYLTARVRGTDKLADTLLHIYDNCTTMTEVVAAKGKSENIRAMVGWINPAKYSAKLQLEVQHTVDLSKALREATNRVIPVLEQARLDRAMSPNAPTLPEVQLHDLKRQDLVQAARYRAYQDNQLPIQRAEVINPQVEPIAAEVDTELQVTRAGDCQNDTSTSQVEYTASETKSEIDKVSESHDANALSNHDANASKHEDAIQKEQRSDD